MNPYDFLVIGIIALIVGGAIAFMIISNKRGKKCIGCPESGSCPAKKGGTDSCSGKCASGAANCHGKKGN